MAMCETCKWFSGGNITVCVPFGGTFKGFGFCNYDPTKIRKHKTDFCSKHRGK